jgi:uncharacterized Zn finger protein (UPF0148 family)
MSNCKKCGTELTTQKSGAIVCKPCRAAYMREYYKKNPHVLAEQYARHKDATSVKTKKWKEANRDRLLEYSRRYYAEKLHLHRAYYEAHKSEYFARRMRRVAVMKSACPLWSNLRDIAKIYAESKRVSEETGILHHVDHIVPLSGKMVCGLHVPENLRVIPAKENRMKSNRMEL